MAMMRVPEKRAGGIPQYRQQPAYDTTPGANLGARLSDSAGGIAAQGAQSGWQAVINTGKAVQGAAKVGFDLYTEYSRTKAQEAYNKFQESMQSDLYGENGIFNRKGKNALTSVTDAEKIMRERAGELEKSLGDMGKEFFQKQIGTYGRQLLPQVQRHATSEFNLWMDTTDDATAELERNRALENINDPEVFKQCLFEGGMALTQKAVRNGYSEEQKKLLRDEYASGTYLAAGVAQVSQGNLSKAESLLKSGMLMPAHKLKLETEIRNERKRQEAKAEADRAKAMSNLLFGLEDARYAARYMGDTSQLTAIGDQLRNLGDTKRADAIFRQARFWNANNEARDYAVRAPIEDVVSSITALDKRLTAEKDNLSIEEFQKESQRRDAMSEILKDRVAALKADPALAADRDPAVVLPDGATTGDRITARMEYQAMNGITESNRMPLTKTEAASLAEKWQKGGVEQKAALLYGDGGIIKEFGPYALNVMAQVGISETEQDYAQRVMDNPENATAASTILRVQNINEKDLPSVKVTDALEDVLERSTVYQSRRAMTLKVNSAAALSAAKQLETVAERMLKQGYSADEVVKTLDAGVVGVSDSNMALTYPAGRSATVLEQRLNRAFTDDLPGFFENDPRLSKNPLDIKYQIARLRNVGVWTNAPDGKGYVLVDGVTKRPVTDGNGNIFTVKSKDIFENPSSAVPDSLLNIQGGAW